MVSGSSPCFRAQGERRGAALAKGLEALPRLSRSALWSGLLLSSVLAAGCSSIWRKVGEERVPDAVRETGRTETATAYALYVAAMPRPEWPELRLAMRKVVVVTVHYTVESHRQAVETRLGPPGFDRVKEDLVVGLVSGVMDATVGPVVAPVPGKQARRVDIQGSHEARPEEERQVDVRPAPDEALAVAGFGSSRTDEVGVARFPVPAEALDRGVRIVHPASGLARVALRRSLRCGPGGPSLEALVGGTASYPLYGKARLKLRLRSGRAAPLVFRVGLLVDPERDAVAHVVVDEVELRCLDCDARWTVSDVEGDRVLVACPGCRGVVEAELGVAAE
ncbi:MAG: hypothetical protein HYZ53_25085 [Planctomycetes bacterium]|nr:hypothetical protein [Planctomycetota bacterium]